MRVSTLISATYTALRMPQLISAVFYTEYNGCIHPCTYIGNMHTLMYIYSKYTHVMKVEMYTYIQRNMLKYDGI